MCDCGVDEERVGSGLMDRVNSTGCGIISMKDDILRNY